MFIYYSLRKNGQTLATLHIASAAACKEHQNVNSSNLLSFIFFSESSDNLVSHRDGFHSSNTISGYFIQSGEREGGGRESIRGITRILQILGGDHVNIIATTPPPNPRE